MSRIRISKQSNMDVTLVQNTFIDHYMPKVSGEFVKIYLYLLRLTAASKEVSLSSVADLFECTESDVRRALKYWEKMLLLDMTFTEEGDIASISFLDPQYDEEEAAAMEEVLPLSKPFVAPPKLPLDTERMEELTSQEEIKQLLFIASQYIGRPLTSTETSNILYYYDSLHFSADLIEYLVEYCVSKGNKSARYMEKVALSWAKEGITSVTDAKNSSSFYNKKYYSVLNAFGIKGRGPGRTEREFIDRWFSQYGFDLSIIEEACSRTIAKTHSPSFPYADRILSDWHKKGIHSLAEIRALDEERMQKQKERLQSEKREKPQAGSNRFNNFSQRDYDFDKLEKQLLNR